MLPFILNDHSIIPAEGYCVDLSNRAFLFGDGIFESIAVYNGMLMFAEDHLFRFYQGLEALDLIAEISIKELHHLLNELVIKNNLKYGKLKLHGYRVSEGQYKPIHDQLGVLATAETMDDLYNGQELNICFYTEAIKTFNKVSQFKTHSSLANVLASVYCRDHGFNDAIFFNQFNEVVESTSSNIFIVREDIIHTPPINSGCVAGVLRKRLIDFLQMEGYSIKETGIGQTEIMEAEEIFLTNSIRGILPVKFVENTRYPVSFTIRLRNSFYYLKGIKI